MNADKEITNIHKETGLTLQELGRILPLGEELKSVFDDDDKRHRTRVAKTFEEKEMLRTGKLISFTEKESDKQAKNPSDKSPQR